MLLTPSLMILSTPSLRLSIAMVCVARISTASVVAKAGIIPSTPFNSLALIISHLLSKFRCFRGNSADLYVLFLRLVNRSAKVLSNKTVRGFGEGWLMRWASAEANRRAQDLGT